MAIKPAEEVINASSKKLDPRAVLTAIISETPELRDAAIAEGIVQEIEVEDD